jgi:hypothetical protein
MPSVKKVSKGLTLEQAIESVKSELTVKSDGVGYCSIRGAARLSGVDESSLREAFNHTLVACDSNLSDILSGAGKNLHKLTQTLIDRGFDVRGFSEKGIQDLALQQILKYYAYKAGARCTEIAELCLDAFSAMGIRTWIQNIAGWKSEVEVRSKALEKADSAIATLKEVQKLHPVTYQMAIQSLGCPPNNNALELADTSSLVANRLGLAFNKQIKAFEKLSDATSPEAFDSLKEAYYKLAEQHAELLKLKTAQPTIEYVDKIVEKVVVKTEVVEKIVEVPSGNPLVEYALRSENNDLKAENKDLQRQLNNLWSIYNESQGNSKSSEFQLPPGRGKH